MLFALVWFACSVNQNQIRAVEQLMAFHQFWRAYQELNNLISRESRVDNRLYRLRAQCCLNMAMVKECIEDTKRILKNSPSAEDKKMAYVFQARSYIQRGDFTTAEDAAKRSQDRQLIRNCQELQRIESTAADKAEKGQTDEAAQLYDQLLRNAPKATHFSLARANLAWEARDLGRFKELTKDLENEFPNDANLVYRRAIVSLCDGQMDPALRGLKRAKGMRGAPKNASVAFDAAQAVNTNYPNAQKMIEKRNVKEAEASLKHIRDAADQFCPADSVLGNSASMLELKLIKLKHTPEETLEILNGMLEKTPDSLELMLERGDLELELGDYDAALFDFSNAQRRNPGSHRAQEGIAKAQDLKRKASFVDHYAILGISKGAGESEIKAAYKKKVREWHPDRFGDKKKKAEAESMMKKINTAYDILGDHERRRLYDAGQDPDDVGAGQNMNFNFNPFNMGFQQGGGAQFFHFGGGQGVHFEFHF